VKNGETQNGDGVYPAQLLEIIVQKGKPAAGFYASCRGCSVQFLYPGQFNP